MNNNTSEIMLNKPNQLINLQTKFKITSTQKKAFNIFLKNAQNNIKFKNFEGPLFEISAKILHEEAGIKKKDENHLREELEKLMSIIISVSDKDNKNNWEAFPLLRYIQRKGDFYYYKLEESVIESLKNQTFFTPLNLFFLKNLQSHFSIIFYELAMRYKKLKIPRMSIEEFRELTNTENKYPRFFDLEKRVLIPTCEEISEKTDIQLNYETEKTGKSITHINFFMKSKGIDFIDEKPQSDSIKSIFSDEEKAAIKKYCKAKISFDIALDIFIKYKSKNFDYLIYCLRKTEEKAIINPIAYFEKMIKEAEIEYTNFQNLFIEKQEAKKKLEAIRQQEELKEIELKNSKELEANKILENKNSQEYLDLRKDVLVSLKQGYLEKGHYKKIPENDIPIEIIDKYVKMSILSQI